MGFTDAKIKAMKLSTGKTYQRKALGDGLYLRMRMSGSGLAKHFEYRAQVNGQRKFITLGEYSDAYGLSAANKKRAELESIGDKAKRGDGDHPVMTERFRREDRLSDPTVASLFAAWIADKRLGSPKTGGKPVRESTISLLQANFDNDIKKRIGDLKMAQIGRAAVEDCIDTVRRRGAPGQAAQVYRTLRGLTRFAQRKGYLAADPMLGVDNPKPYNPRVEDIVAATDAELKALFAVLDSSRISIAVRLAIELSLLTGARPSEIRLARRSEFDVKGAVWNLPAERVKSDRPFRIHLSPQAVEVVKAALKTPGKEYLFTGQDGPLEKMAVARALARIADRLKAQGCRKLRPHDLRRTHRTMMSRIGIRPDVAEKCLNHQDTNVLSRVYDGYHYESEMAEAWNKAGAHLAALRFGGAEVIALKNHRA